VAGAVLAVLVVLVGWRMGTWQAEPRVSGAVTTYTTGRGQRAAITLPDGSRVVLSVASRLDIPADYLSGNRTVTLEGEALFTVEHQSRAPFTVLAGQSTTRVLGTSFAVRHYASDSVATVAVRDGKVAVRDVILTAGQQVQVAENGTMHVGVARDAQFGFATGTLSLDNLPLADAMTELSRWYDVELRLGAPSLASLRMTGEFAAGSVSDLQNILELTYDVRVVRTGRVLTLYPR
jgi:transmembrane sensor